MGRYQKRSVEAKIISRPTVRHARQNRRRFLTFLAQLPDHSIHSVVVRAGLIDAAMEFRCGDLVTMTVEERHRSFWRLRRFEEPL